MRLKIASVIDVAERQLCCGCGACAGDGIEMVDVPEHGRRPYAQEWTPRLRQLAEERLKVCPGAELSHEGGPGDGREGIIEELAAGWGPVLEVWEGYAADETIRFRGSSGGGVTALSLWALEHGGMEGVLHIAARPDAPYLNETVLSHDRAGLLRGSGSRYAPASPCDGLSMIEQADGPCVFVGKPCDVAGTSKVAKFRPALKEKLGLTIAIFCAATPNTRGTLEMLKRLNVEDPADLKELRYRGHGWPGEATAVTDQGVVGQLSYDASWGKILSRHAQWRCRICPDHTGEFADVAVGDPWYREIEPGDPGRSMFIVRTERGRRAVREAVASGILIAERTDHKTLPASQPNLLDVRGNVWMRMLVSRLLGAAVPVYTNIPTARFWWSELTLIEKVRSVTGTVKRVFLRGLRTRTPMRPDPATNLPRRAAVEKRDDLREVAA